MRRRDPRKGQAALVAVTMFERIGEDWVGPVFGPDSLLWMPEIDVAVPIAEFYEGLDLPPRSAEDDRAA